MLAAGFETETEFTVHALELRMAIGEVATRYRDRPAGSVSKLLATFERPVDPGLVSVPHWRPVIEPAGLLNAYAGMGRNPWSTNRVLAGSTLPVQSRRLSSPVSKMFYLPMEGPPAPTCEEPMSLTPRTAK